MDEVKKCFSCDKEITHGWKIDFDYVCHDSDCMGQWFVFNATEFDEEDDSDET